MLSEHSPTAGQEGKERLALRWAASSLLAWVTIGTVLALWVLLGWHAHTGRVAAIEDAFMDQTTFAETYAEYAETLIQFGGDTALVIDDATEDPEQATSPEQHLLADFQRVIRQHRNFRLRLRRFDNSVRTEPVLANGVLTVTVSRPFTGLAAVVEWPETEALADWRDALILDCGALSVVTLLMAGLGTVLVRQLRRHERAEIARRDLERHLHHSQRLESLGTLAGGIAHDLNNALVPILALTKMAMSDTSEGCAIREDLSLVYQAGIRARDLVKRILAFGRKEMGERRRVQINEIAAEAMSMLRSTIPGMITITSEIEDVPPVLGDATEIHQVIVNLATNAVQAIGTGHGTVSIRVSRADMQDGTERQGARVVISDTGCGMSPQTLERIFEPFFTTKAVGEGTGLGLAVVHGIVMGLGGRIDVQSELGRGTSFTLIFPEATLDLASRGEQRRAA